MKQNYCIILIITAFSLLFTQKAEAQFEISAQYRNRLEVRDGYQKIAIKDASPAIFLGQRTRISFSYKTEKLKLKITPQDVRIWGDEKSVSSTGTGYTPTLDLFEGYAELKIGASGWLSIGRQQLKYDNERFLSARNWNNAGLAYDVAVYKFENEKLKFHVGSSWNTLSEANSENLYPTDRYKTLNFLWLNYTINEKMNFSLLHIANGVTETDTTNNLNFRQTTGFYSTYKSNSMYMNAEAFFQYGKNKIGTDVSAYLLGLEAGYNTEKISVGVGINYLSGNSKVGEEQTTDHLFDILYGARHKFYGYADYFRTFSTHTKQGGLVDAFFNLTFNPSEKLNISNTTHYFQLAEKNSTTPEEKNLGLENDFVVKYKFNQWGAFELGYMFFSPTDGMLELQNVSDEKFSQFLYLQLTLTPTLLKQ